MPTINKKYESFDLNQFIDEVTEFCDYHPEFRLIEHQCQFGDLDNLLNDIIRIHEKVFFNDEDITNNNKAKEEANKYLISKFRNLFGRGELLESEMFSQLFTGLYTHEYDRIPSHMVERCFAYGDEAGEEMRKYVPSAGPASTVYGELIRAIHRVLYRVINDGDSPYKITNPNFLDFIYINKIIRDYDLDSEDNEFYEFTQNLPFELHSYSKGRQNVFYVQDTEFYELPYFIKVLIEYKKLHPEFLADKNDFDSRSYHYIRSSYYW